MVACSETIRGSPMSVLCDWQIERDVKIEPFAPGASRPNTISWGLSAYGYDARIDRHFKVFTNVWGSVVDPKNFDPKAFVDVEGDYCIIPPNSFALATTIEHFEIPRDILCICMGKSTYARCGIIANITPLEPEWKGRITIEISNTTPLPAKVYAGEGFAQILFLRSDGLREADHLALLGHFVRHDGDTYNRLLRPTHPTTCRVSYADKKGRYNGQVGITLPFVEQPTIPKEEPK